MSDTKAPPQIVVTSWVDNVPLFVMTEGLEELMENIEDNGCLAVMEEGEEPQLIFPQVYYVVAEETTTEETKSSTGVITKVSKTTSGVYKVVKNLIGSAVSKVDGTSIGLEKIKQQAYFTLPSIPWSLINDIDDFFRYVFSTHGTEAIIIFTYDMSYENSDEPSDGWGFLVPDQTNSAASCDYEPESIIDELPDDKDIRLVGTAHSHPNMPAYCSGTDKKDQAQFDGIHITYGWNRGSLVTDFYVELQMGGGQFIFKADDIFKDMPKKEYSEETKQLGGKVKKAASTAMVGYGDYYGHSTTGKNWWSEPETKKYPGLPSNCPTPNSVALIASPLLTEKELDSCPVCEKMLNKREKEAYKCLRCQTFIMPVEMNSIEDLIAAREAANVKSFEIDLKNGKYVPHKAIWLWEETLGTDNKSIVDVVKEIHPGREQAKK